MKPRKLKSSLTLNKKTVTDLSELAQNNIKGGISAYVTCPVYTQCLPGYYTECKACLTI